MKSMTKETLSKTKANLVSLTSNRAAVRCWRKNTLRIYLGGLRSGSTCLTPIKLQVFFLQRPKFKR